MITDTLAGKNERCGIFIQKKIYKKHKIQLENK